MLYGPLILSSFQFFDSRFVCQGEGREVSRVSSRGTVDLSLQVVIKGLEEFGYCL